MYMGVPRILYSKLKEIADNLTRHQAASKTIGIICK